MKVSLLGDPIDSQKAGIHVYTREMALSIQQYCKQIDLQVIRSADDSSIITSNNHILKDRLIPGYKAFRMFFIIPSYLKKLKPDVVIEPAHFGPFNLPKSIKRVTIIHDLTPIKFPKWHNWHHGWLQKLFLPSIFKRATLIISNSDNTLNDLNEMYPQTIGKSVRIYPGVDPYFKLSEENFNEEKEPFFLTTGTIEPRKNLNTLLKAYQLFRENSKNKLKLIICGGKGWKSEDFYHQLSIHPYRDDIEIKGYVSKEKLKNLYLTTTAFIYPSFYEGFGFPVAEAMGCGAPCIVSKSSSLTEVGGDAVLYFDPQSAELLHQQMETLCQSKEIQKNLMKKGFIQIDKFKWSSFAFQIEKVLNEI